MQIANWRKRENTAAPRSLSGNLHFSIFNLNPRASASNVGVQMIEPERLPKLKRPKLNKRVVAIKTGSSPVVTEPRAVATGPLLVEKVSMKQQAGRYRSRFCNDRVASPPADSHF